MKTLDMPSFGADMETGKVVEWCAKEGDTLKKGDTVALIETAKGLIDMEVFDDCVIGELLAPLDTEIPVGQAIIALAGVESAAEAELQPQRQTQPRQEQKPEPVSLRTDSERPSNVVAFTPDVAVLRDSREGRTQSARRITPAAKKYLADHPQPLDQVVGSGVADAICLADVMTSTAVDPSTTANVPRGGFDPNAMRKAIAAVVSRSKREIPHYYLSLDIDLKKSEDWLTVINEVRQPEERLMINVPIMCAVARALHKHPDFNGFYQNDSFSHANDVHLGLAIRLRNKGLVTPAIHHADQLDAFAMMERLKSIVERSKLGGLKQSELQDATTTLSNIGDRGTDQIFPVIFPPQVAIIGVGKVTKRAVVVGEEICIHPMVNVSLAADHRVTDGQMGARLLNEINKFLQHPEKFAGGMQ